MLTLDELWYGNIGYESHTSGDREYSRETKKLLALSEKLIPMLSDEQKQAFDKFNDQQLHVYAISEKDAFVAGVRLGAELILDVLCDVDVRRS